MAIESRPDQRSHGWRFGSPEHRQAILDARTCAWCGASLKGKRAIAKVCSARCGTYNWRRERRRAAVLARPRCLICLGPMPYKSKWQGPGVKYSDTTCSAACRLRRQALRESMLRG